jgi:radical SAM superfamily enzyme YgiQ (UPF0313 family)
MDICLIGAPTVTEFGEDAKTQRIREGALHPPLGVLTLAAILRNESLTPAILDLNQLYYEYLGDSGARADRDFCTYAASRVPCEANVIGLSTICSSYPLTIRLAERLKRAWPDKVIVLGGPQASVVDVATLEAFRFIDVVVRGEADETLPKVLHSDWSPESLASIPGITFRDGRTVVRNIEAPLVRDLDSVPFPAFDLMPDMDKLPYIALELGRGCPFACTFCSTNDFFRRRFRLKSPELILAQMRRAKAEYRARSFDLVHDMFTVDRKRVVAFCETMIDSGEHFRWSCSARTDCIDDELIQLMYRAGCRGIFFGVETGSPRMQRLIHKNLDLEEAAARIRRTTSGGIGTTVSLITGFPEETEQDVEQTVGFLMRAARHELADPQLHILAPLAGTPMHRQFHGELLLDGVYSDMSHQGWKQDTCDRDLIASFPDIFPNFYGVPTPGLDRAWLKRLRIFVLRGIERFRWVTVALHQSRGGIKAVFETWDRATPTRGMDGEDLERYYASPDFRMDFTEFVRTTYLRGEDSDPALDGLLRLGENVSVNQPESPVAPRGRTRGRRTKNPPHLIVPFPGPGVKVFDLDVDLRTVFESLRRGEGLPGVHARRPITIATRSGLPSTTDIVQLTPFSASFLRLCDGRTLDLVIANLDIDAELESIGREQVGLYTLDELCRQRLLKCANRTTKFSIQCRGQTVTASTGALGNEPPT